MLVIFVETNSLESLFWKYTSVLILERSLMLVIIVARHSQVNQIWRGTNYSILSKGFELANFVATHSVKILDSNHTNVK